MKLSLFLIKTKKVSTYYLLIVLNLIYAFILRTKERENARPSSKGALILYPGSA